MTSRESSGGDDGCAEEPNGSSTSESDVGYPLLLHNGKATDFVTTRGSLDLEMISGIKTHSLSNLTRRPEASGSGEAIPGSMNDSVVELASTMMVEVAIVRADGGG